MTHRPLRLAIVGGNRGGRFQQALAALEEQIRLTAICDIDDHVLQRWKQLDPHIGLFKSYEELLHNPDIDAVFLASPMQLHACQSIAALRAGKHVLSEVIAALTLDEAWELLETVEQTRLTYMMAENYVFARSNLAVKNMSEQGMFGEITYLEGGYIHELRPICLNARGELTWRGQLHHTYNGMNYPTHSIGPVAQWIGVNKPGGDELATMSTFVSNSRALRHYCREHLGGDHPAAQDGYWKQGDTAVTTIRTRNGALITLRVDWTSPRPHNKRHYVLQGTEGAYLSARHEHEDDLVWFHGRSPNSERHGEWKDNELDERWEPLRNYQPQYDHPHWRRWEEHAIKSGHDGGDFFVLEEFASAIRERRAPVVDVYDAVTWSSIFPLSMESAAKGGVPVALPDFRKHLKLREMNRKLE